MQLAKPINEVQQKFHGLCRDNREETQYPDKRAVFNLLCESGKNVNKNAYKEVRDILDTYKDANPWHVCFAIGIYWGHLSTADPEFIRAAISVLEDYNDKDLRIAETYHLERGPEPIRQSLMGGYTLFNKVRLPKDLPDKLETYKMAQERWLSPILSDDRPKYIGSWHATAMFMVALFSKPDLGQNLRSPIVMLPPCGPLFNALSILYKMHVLSQKPSGSELDDQSFEPGAIYENNALFSEICSIGANANLLDIHSGLYMLGTRDKQSDTYIIL